MRGDLHQWPTHVLNLVRQLPARFWVALLCCLTETWTAYSRKLFKHTVVYAHINLLI